MINEVVIVIGSCEETGHQCNFMTMTRDTSAISGEMRSKALQAVYTWLQVVINGYKWLHVSLQGYK